MDALAALSAPLEAWEGPGLMLTPTPRTSRSRNGAQQLKSLVAPSSTLPAQDDGDRVSVGSVAPSVGSVGSSVAGSKHAFLCGLDSLDELAFDVLRGSIDAAPARERSAFGALVAAGTVGELTDVVYPPLAPRAVQLPPPNPALTGILGPDVTIVAADKHPNVVMLLPCHTWEQAMCDEGRPDPTLADAICVAVAGIASPSDIRVFGDPVGRIPFVARCRCCQRPCLCELPADWAVSGCDLDAPALVSYTSPPRASLLYSPTFGKDAEAAARTRYLTQTRARMPSLGDLHDQLLQSEDSGGHNGLSTAGGARDLMATRFMTAAGHGKGSLMDVALHNDVNPTVHEDGGVFARSLTRTGEGARFSSSLSLTRRSGDSTGVGGTRRRMLQSTTCSTRALHVGGCVNESRQALRGRVRVHFDVHRVWGPDEDDRAELQETHPGRSFHGTVELYQAVGCVADVPACAANTTDTAKELARLADGVLRSPSKDAVVARLVRKASAAPAPAPATAGAAGVPTIADVVEGRHAAVARSRASGSPAPRSTSGLGAAGRQVVVVVVPRQSGPDTDRSSRSSRSATGSARSGWAATSKAAARAAAAETAGRGGAGPVPKDARPNLLQHPTALLDGAASPRDWVVCLSAVGCCDVEEGLGWAEYTAHDAQQRLLWALRSDGRARLPFDAASMPHPELLLPVLAAVGPHEPLGTSLRTLAHALFPARADAMWHYLRSLHDWDGAHAHLVDAQERVRLRVTLHRLPDAGIEGVDMATDFG